MGRLGLGVLLAAILLGALAVLVTTARDDTDARARAASRPGLDHARSDTSARDDARRIRALEARVEALEGEVASLREAVRASFLRGASEGGEDPATFLDLYLLSFEKSGGGSEYFRLAVDAHAPHFVDRLLGLVADASQPLELRLQLIEILGTERFRGDGRVVESLLGLLRADTPVDIARSALEALAVTGNGSAVPALERYAGEVPWSNLPYEIYDAIAELAGEQRNAVLRRLMPDARDEVARTMILDRVDRADAPGALLLFQDAWTLDKETRIAAADRLGDFRADEFKRFVDERLAVETDPDVRASLERAKESQARIPDFDAMQAAGPPDADPNADDPRAWASKRGDMGIQWLELSYRPPLRARRLRIFEVNSAGAVVEVQVVDANGGRHTAWRGTDPTARPGPFDLRVDSGSARVAKVRLVLDTSRRPGWNEIDAVELIGPDGRAWASSAVASSTYGN